MRRSWTTVASILALTLAASGCDPVGRGIVSEPVPENQLVRSVHPTHNVHWSRPFGPAASSDFRCLAVGDLDGDKLPDLVAGGFARRGVRCWLANGDGTWSSIDGPGHFGLQTGLALGDVNGDKRLDLVVAGRGEVPGVRVWLNTLDKTEEWTEGQPATITNNYLGAKLADVNGDGFPDIIASRDATDGHGGIAIWLNRKGEGWSQDVGPRNAQPYQDVALADFNNDGQLDLVAARWGNPGGLEIWYGNGRGAWARAKEDPAYRLNYQGVDVADFNGDGEMDIVATAYRSDVGALIFLNDRRPAERRSDNPRKKFREAGWWTQYVPLAGKGSFWDAKALDLNGDKLPDVAVSSFDGRGVRVWLQLPRQQKRQKEKGEEPEPEGDEANKDEAGKTKPEERDEPFVIPRFMEQSFQFPQKGTYFAIESADFNTDGKPELVAATEDEGVKAWFQTDERGQLSTSPYARPTAAPGRNLQPFDEDAPRDPKENRSFVTIKRKDGLRYTEYRIGPGDVVKIEIYEGRRVEPRTFVKAVESSGQLLVPLASRDPINVVDKDGIGMSPSQLRDMLTRQLEATELKEPAVAVTVQKHLSRMAEIYGEIRVKPNQSQTGPGQYVLRGKTRVLEFIARHGGFTDKADLAKVEVRSINGEKRVLDLFKAIFQSKLSQDIVLDQGDKVYIPPISTAGRKVYVLGEVGRPGVYDLRDRVRLIGAIQLADSFTRRANRKQVVVVRGDRNKPQLHQINVLEMLKTGDLSKNMMLENDDIVYVPKDWIGNLQEFYSWFLPIYAEYRR